MSKVLAKGASKSAHAPLQRRDEIAKTSVRRRDFPYVVQHQKQVMDQLVDQAGRCWVVDRDPRSKASTELSVFTRNGALWQRFSVQGRPNFFEFGRQVYVGCEGDDGQGHIYAFSENAYTLIGEWTVDGFLWGLEIARDRLYVTSYWPSADQAVLDVIEEKERHTVRLGSHIFPTDMLYAHGMLYVATSPVLGCEGKKIMRLNHEGELIAEYPQSVAPRQLYALGDELGIYALDLPARKTETGILLNPANGRQTAYRPDQIKDMQVAISASAHNETAEEIMLGL